MTEPSPFAAARPALALPRRLPPAASGPYTRPVAAARRACGDQRGNIMKATAAAAFAAIAAACAAPAASAQNNTMFDGTTMMRGFTVSGLAQLATDLGLTSRSLVYNNGAAGLEITTPEGYQFYMQPTACNPQCAGLYVHALFGPSSNTTVSALNSFNEARAAAKAYTSNQSIILSRYIIADYGTPRGNIAIEFGTFVSLGVTFADYLQRGVGTVSDKIEQPADGAAEKPALDVSYAAGAPHGDSAAASAFLGALFEAGDAKTFRE